MNEIVRALRPTWEQDCTLNLIVQFVCFLNWGEVGVEGKLSHSLHSAYIPFM